jgi:hypothetical protein
VSRDGKWNPNVSTREIGDRARENGADQGDVLLSTVDGVYVTLRIISHQARGFLEEGQHPFDDPQIKLDRREKSDHIISIELGTKTEVIPAQLLEQAPRVSLAEQGMEALHHQHKEHGRGGGGPLSMATTVENPITWNVIKKDSSASSREKSGYPICPNAWTADRSQKVEKKDPPKRIKSLSEVNLKHDPRQLSTRQ